MYIYYLLLPLQHALLKMIYYFVAKLLEIYFIWKVLGSKASFSYIESCLARTSLILLSFIHQPWLIEILKLIVGTRHNTHKILQHRSNNLIHINVKTFLPFLEVSLLCQLLNWLESKCGLFWSQHSCWLGCFCVNCSLKNI